MLYVLYGSDPGAGRAKLDALLVALLKKRPGASLFRLTADEVTLSGLLELSGARGLFEPKHIVLLDLPFAISDSRAVVLDQLEALRASENLFVLFEGALDAKTLAALRKKAEKVQEHSAAKKSAAPKETFNRFALPEALGRRDRKNLWVHYQRAVRAGMVPEEIHGLLFWQVKCMLLSSTARDAASAGLKPFVYGKAKAAAKNFSLEELRDLSENLTVLYHESRRGAHELDTALERFVLSV